MKVHVAESRAELGRLAAHDIGEALRDRLRRKDHLHLILAAAPSQSEMLAARRSEPDIDWQRVKAFHLDEYIGLPQVIGPDDGGIIPLRNLTIGTPIGDSNWSVNQRIG